MAKFSQSKAEELADTCIQSPAFYSEMLSFMSKFKERLLSKSDLIVLVMELRRSTTGVLSGLALSTGYKANDLLYSHYSEEVFGYYVPEHNVDHHQDCVDQGNLSSYEEQLPKGTQVSESKLKVGDKFVVIATGGHHRNTILGATLTLIKLDYIGQSSEKNQCHYYINEDGDEISICSYRLEPLEPKPLPIPDPQIGDYFKVVAGGGGTFSIGSIIQLESEPSSSAPLCKLIQGTCIYTNAKGGNLGAWVQICELEPFAYTGQGYDDSSLPIVDPLGGSTQQPAVAKVAAQLKTQEETQMKASNIIATQINVFGQNAVNLSDEEIFDCIARVDAEVERLGKTKTKSKKLEAKIKDLEAQNTALVEYVDSRD